MSRRWIVMAAAIAGILALAAGAGARSSGRAWATAAQTTLGSIGEQPTLVFLVKYGQGCSSDGVDCSTRAFERVGTVGPPRNTARQWQSILNQRVNQRYGAASYGRVHWTFRVVANPGSPDGWWPAPHTIPEYARVNNFGQGGIVRDAATTLLDTAISLHVISFDQVLANTRLLVIDNYHSRGGQEGGGLHQFVVRTSPRSWLWYSTAAIVGEDSNDDAALSAINHELGHQLGEPDLYSTPCDPNGDEQLDPCRCPYIEPNGRADPALGIDPDCVGQWDTMAFDAIDRSFGAYTRIIAGWLSPAEPITRLVSRRFSGTVRLWPVERLPRRDRPTVLRLAGLSGAALQRTQLATQLLALTGAGRRIPYAGYQAECRRSENDDQGAPKSGVLVAWVDDTRPRDHPEHIVRRLQAESIDEAILEPGETYGNYFNGVSLTMRGFDADGSCIFDVNYNPATVPNLAAPFAEVAGQTAGRFSLRSSTPVFTATGVTLGPDNRSRLEPVPPEKGVPEFLRFGVVNSGSAVVRGGWAVLRVSQPYVVADDCGRAARPLGAIAGRVKIPILAPGAGAIVGTSWRSHGDDSTGLAIALQAPRDALASDNVISSAFAFQTHRLVAGKAPAEQLSTVILRVSRACHDAVWFAAVPLATPAGWEVAIRGAGTPVRPGSSRRVTIALRAPAGAKAGTLVVPIQFRAAVANLWNRAAVSEGDLDSVGGLDVIARVVRGNGRPAPFRIAASSLGLPANVPGPPAPTPPPPAPEPTPTQPSSPAVTLAELSLADSTVEGGNVVSAAAVLTGPAPAGGATVSLTSSSTAVASVPESVLVAPGSTSATVQVSAGDVGSTQAVTIMATYGGATRTATLTVTPKPEWFDPSLNASYDEKADILTVKGSGWDSCGNEVDLTLETKGGTVKLGSVTPNSSGKFELDFGKSGAAKGDTVRATQVTCAGKQALEAKDGL
jgi:alpha-galactosidase-like protein